MATARKRLLTEYGTAGCPIREYVVPNAVHIAVVTNDRETNEVICDAVISHIEEGVIINDKLSEELGIIILAAGSGKWRLIDDDINRVRTSESPQYW